MIINSLNLILLIAIGHIMFYPANNLKKIKDVSLIYTYIIFVISLFLLQGPADLSFFFESFSKNIIFFPNFVLNFSFVVDGLSIYFVLLTTFLFVLLALTTRSIGYRVKEKFLLLFVLELLLINCFTSTEIFFFYIFFETILIPMYLLIGIWGSQRNKIFAANQFFLYTLFGSFFMLIGITICFVIFGSSNLFIIKSFLVDSNLEKLLFCLFFVSFSVKVPMFPFHLWLPKAHVEAPTVGSVLLAGVLLKLGSYGFLRYSLFLFPNASMHYAPIIIAICVISVIFSSLTTMRQIDLKRIIAYSSVAHMNYLIAGLFSNSLLGIVGSLLLQIAHGLSSSALFLCVGFLYERHKTRNIFYYRGMVTLMPIFTFFFFIFSLANLGFPGTVNFVSELLLFFGLLETNLISAMLMLFGIFFSALYSFLLLSRLCFGTHSLHVTSYSDLTRREFLILLPLFIFVIYLGLAPNKLFYYWKFIIETWYIHI